MSFIITIGRQYGSGGRYIARELAKRLDIKFYDNEILAKAAEKSGLCLEYLKENDEKKDSIFAYMGIGNSNHLTASQKVSLAQFQAIRDIADSDESCVIVGRCASYVLRDRDNIINVFINAPIEERIARAVNYYGLKPEKAQSVIHKMDKNRESYYSFFTDQKWGKAENYDLCINSQIGIQETVDIIVELLKKKIKDL